MLDSLTQRLTKVVKTIRGQARLTESNMQDMLREIRIALLEADVAIPVVKDLIARIKEKALGTEVQTSLTPGQALVGIVHDELTKVIGGEDSQEKYKNIKFVKMFDNDTSRVVKTIRKYSKLGFQMFLWDTMKSDDDVSMEMYRQLLVASRKVFQAASRENVAVVCTYQLALYLLNQRYLDANCLSNGKQIKEVFSEMIYIRPLWEDEYTGERYDCKAYTRGKNADGSWEKFTTPITLDKTKKYIVAFLDKTRNDEDKQQVLYETNLTWNNWREVGFCTIRNEHVQTTR